MFDRFPLPRKLKVPSCRTSTELIGADLHVERLIFVVIWLHNMQVFILEIKSKKGLKFVPASHPRINI
jgi:hypothetical protein